MKDFRFGIIGCGVIGPRHADAICQTEGAVLAAVSDQDPNRAQKLGEQYHVPAYSDYQQMLACEKLDVVCICTPSGLHGRQAIDVMRSGRHVVIEKPMDITLEAIDEMMRVEREMGVKISVICQHRFDDASRQVKQAMERGDLGKVALADCQVKWYRSQAYYDNGGWRGTWAMDGGGVLMNQTIHSIDLLQWLAGPVERVVAYSEAITHNIEAEDTAVAILRFASGALGVVEGTTSAYPGLATRIEICGSNGSALIENDELKLLHIGQEGESFSDYGARLTREAQQEAGRQAPAPNRAHQAQIQDMVQAIREGRSPLVNSIEGRKPVAIIRAIYESARTGREVRVDM